MMRPARYATIWRSAVTAVALTLGGCASASVSSYVARGVDLHQPHTYNWAPADEQSTGDPRLDNNRFFQERVETAIERHLAQKGFRKSSSPDLLVRYRASVAQETYFRGSARPDGSCDDCGPELYDAGTLLIDLVDARTDGLVWRGWAKGSIDGVIDDQSWMEQRVDEAVARIMRRLP